jgi:Tol biopolymer transport system component
MKRSTSKGWEGLLTALLLAGFQQHHATAQTVRLVSAPDPQLTAGYSGTAQGASELGRFSRDGRFLVFVSSAANLVTNSVSGPYLNVYRHDLSSGINTLISATASRRSGRGDSFAPDISADGRYVAFASRASDLVADDTNEATDVFVHDTLTGTTRRVSVGPGGLQASAESAAPRLTPDGRWLCFGSRASNLDPALPDTPGRMDVFVRDLEAGETRRINPENRPEAAFSVEDYDLSDDGRWVAFTTASTNVVATPPTGIPTGAFVHDRQNRSTVRLEIESGLAPQFRGVLETRALAFAPGRARLAFTCRAAGTSASISNFVQIMDLETPGPRTVAVAPGAHGLTTDDPLRLAFANDGESLAFVQSIRSGQSSVLRFWRSSTGFETLLHPVSNQPLRARELALSPDGRSLAFTSTEPDLLPESSATNQFQLYLFNPSEGRLERLSLGRAGQSLGGVEQAVPQFSPDGRRVAFQSVSGSQVEGDGNGATDVFLRDPELRTTTVVSAPGPGVDASPTSPGSSSLIGGGVSADGRFVLFSSLSDHLVAEDTKGQPDLFVRDLVLGTTRLVTVPGDPNGPVRPGFGEAVISASGRFVAFTGDRVVESGTGPTLSPQVFLRDLTLNRTRVVTVNDSGVPATMRVLSNLRISADGRYVAYFTDALSLGTGSTSRGQVVLTDVLTGEHKLVARPEGSSSTWAVVLAGLGGRVSAVVSLSPVFRAVVLNPRTGVREEVSGGPGSSLALSYDGRRIVQVMPDLFGLAAPVVRWLDQDTPAWRSFSPANDGDLTHAVEALSRDGRWLILRETGVKPGNRRRSTLVLDLANRTTTRLELQPSGELSRFPVSRSATLAPDGRWAAFSSAAPDLTVDDPNEVGDVFVRDLVAGRTTRIARGNGEIPDGLGVTAPRLSADGSTVVFGSWSAGYASADANRAGDIFAARISFSTAANTDADADGLTDSWELTWFGNLERDGNGDYDGDGASERAEFQAGTCPLDDLSRFGFSLVESSPSGLTLEWSTLPGRRYRIQRSMGLVSDWNDFGDPVIGNGSPGRVTLPVAGTGYGFYRLAIEPTVPAGTVP